MLCDRPLEIDAACEGFTPHGRGKQSNDGEGTAGEGDGATEGTLTLRAPRRSLTTEPAAYDPALFPCPPPRICWERTEGIVPTQCRVAGRLAGGRGALSLSSWFGRGGEERPFFFVASLSLCLCVVRSRGEAAHALLT